jgi:hypothetical protein
MSFVIGVVARPRRERVGFRSGDIQGNCGANVKQIGKTVGTRHVSVIVVSRTQLTRYNESDIPRDSIWRNDFCRSVLGILFPRYGGAT